MKDKFQTITTRLPVRLINLLRQEKTESGRALERIIADIISQHYIEKTESGRVAEAQ